MTAGSILLVHGAWHGGWCWARVQPALEVAGFKVSAPTLPGLARQDHVAAPPTLDDHIEAIVNEIDELQGKILLVGHSYGGMVVTGAADRRPNRMAGIVYLDAAVPQNGQNFAAHVPGLDAEGVAGREAAFRELAGGTDWIPVPSFETLGITALGDREWIGPLLRPHPLRTWLDPISLCADGLAAIPRTFVLADHPPRALTGNVLHAAAAKIWPGWRCHDVDVGHEMMVTDPLRTAELILEAA